MLLETEEWEDDSYEWHKDLKIKERQVRIKEFLIWKTKQWLRQNQVKPGARAMARFKAKIERLTNLDEVKYADFKPLLQELTNTDDNKLCRKLFDLIKRYMGRYEAKLKIHSLSQRREKSERAEKAGGDDKQAQQRIKKMGTDPRTETHGNRERTQQDFLRLQGPVPEVLRDRKRGER